MARLRTHRRRRRVRARRNEPRRRRVYVRRRHARRNDAARPWHRGHRRRRVYVRRRHARRNDPAPRRRRSRRNPDGLVLTRPMTWVPYLVTGATSALATGFAPRLLGAAVTPNMAYLAQGGVAVAGGLLLPMLGLRPAHGLVWFLVGGGVIVADLVHRYVMPMFGLAAYPYAAHAALSSMGQTPYYPPRLSQVGAYPYELSRMGAYEPTPGMVAPFDRAYAA